MRPVRNQVKYHVWERVLDLVQFQVPFQARIRAKFAVYSRNPYRMVQVWDQAWDHVRDQVEESLS